MTEFTKTWKNLLVAAFVKETRKISRKNTFHFKSIFYLISKYRWNRIFFIHCNRFQSVGHRSAKWPVANFPQNLIYLKRKNDDDKVSVFCVHDFHISAWICDYWRKFFSKNTVFNTFDGLKHHFCWLSL